MYEMIAHAVADSAKLATLGDVLLLELISGKLRVGSVTKLLEEVT